jgi:hypothetical protein
MNRELNHHQRDDGSREDGQNQPPRDALVLTSQLPNVDGKTQRSRNSARGLFSNSVEPRYFGGSCDLLGNSIKIAAFHGGDSTTGNSHQVARNRARSQTAIASSTK